MSAIDHRTNRIKHVFERVDRKLLEKEGSSQEVRDQIAQQVREVYAASGEHIDDETLARSIEEVMQEEQAKLNEVPPVSIFKKIPGWAWLPIMVGFVIIAVPLARIVLRIVALLFRI